MQGRGRGSYLGLMLETGKGKFMVGAIPGPIKNEEYNSAKNESLKSWNETKVSQSCVVNGDELHADSSPKSVSPTWTSLDLVGNKGRKYKLSRGSSIETIKERKDEQNEPDRISPLQDIDSAILNVSPTMIPPQPQTDIYGSEAFTPDLSNYFSFPDQSSDHFVSSNSPVNPPPINTNLPFLKTKQLASVIQSEADTPIIPISSMFTLYKSPSIKTDPGLQQFPLSLNDNTKPVHLLSPQDLIPPPVLNFDEITETSSETNTSTASGSSVYIPPHKRKGHDTEPEIYNEKEVNENRKMETRQSWRKDPCLPATAVLTESESELNWQKWKLQRSFKKILNNLTVDNVVGIGKDIKDIIGESQLSSKFPGVSELNVILDLLIIRVLDQKETVEFAVHVCRLLNALYPDEFPSNLREIIKEFRQDIFAGVANKNLRCDNFCLLLGKLCDIGKSETKSFQDCLKQCVVGCLYDWISPYQKEDEDSTESKIKLMYLCEILDLTKNVMAAIKTSWVKSCFRKIKNCVLSNKLPREIKESLLDAVLRQTLQPVINKQTTNNEKSLGEVENNSRCRASEYCKELDSTASFLGSNVEDKPTTNESLQSLLTDSDRHITKLEIDLRQTLQEAQNRKSNVTLEQTRDVKLGELYDAKNEAQITQGIPRHQDISVPMFHPSVSHPPPGFLDLPTQNRMSPLSSLVKQALKPQERPVPVGCLPEEKITKREIFVSTANPDFNQNKDGGLGMNMKGNISSLPKHKGRGRGRRDVKGSLETSPSRYPTPGEQRQDSDITSGEVGVGSERSDNFGSFGSMRSIGCFICGAKDHRSAYCTNNKAMFD